MLKKVCMNESTQNWRLTDQQWPVQYLQYKQIYRFIVYRFDAVMNPSFVFVS